MVYQAMSKDKKVLVELKEKSDHDWFDLEILW